MNLVLEVEIFSLKEKSYFTKGKPLGKLYTQPSRYTSLFMIKIEVFLLFYFSTKVVFFFHYSFPYFMRFYSLLLYM